MLTTSGDSLPQKQLQIAAAHDSAPAVQQHVDRAPLVNAGAVYLESLLNRLCALDTSNLFLHPVDEKYAPKYYSIIQQPMCFDSMRSKIRGREYHTWRSFIKDFDLICDNARKYNQQRSRVHKAAVALLRSGKKLLQASELDARKAIHKLHPLGPAAAAAEEAAEQACVEQSHLALAHSFPLAPVYGQSHYPVRPPAAIPKVAVCDYISDSDSDDPDALEATARPPLLSNLSDVLQQHHPSAVFVPYPHTRQQEQQEQRQQEPDGVEACDKLLLPARCTADWKQHRQPAAWQYQWLELRMHLLLHQEHSLQHSMQQLLQQQQQDNGVRGQAVAVQPDPDSRHPMCTPFSGAHPSALRDLPLPDLDDLAHLPIFTDHLPLLRHHINPASSPQTTSQAPSSSAFSLPQPATQQPPLHTAAPAAAPPLPPPAPPAYDSDIDACYPARIFGALDLLEAQLVTVRDVLQQAFCRSTHTPGVPAAPRSNMLADRLPPSKAAARPPKALAPAGSLPQSNSTAKKRRGEDSDYLPSCPSGSGVTPRVEKVANIAIPPIRELPPLERLARETALTTWSASYQATGAPALRLPPPEVYAVLAEGEGSSSEDTSDSTFQRRHLPLEQEEHLRYQGYNGGAQKRNKVTSTSKGNPSFKNPALQQPPQPQQQQQQSRAADVTGPSAPKPMPSSSQRSEEPVEPASTGGGSADESSAPSYATGGASSGPAEVASPRSQGGRGARGSRPKGPGGVRRPGLLVMKARGGRAAVRGGRPPVSMTGSGSKGRGSAGSKGPGRGRGRLSPDVVGGDL